MDLGKAFETFKIDMRLVDMLQSLDDATWMRRTIKVSLQQDGIHKVVKNLQEQIAEGHIDKVIRTIGKEATNLIMY